MAYTKTELRDAVCEAFRYNPETHGTKAQFLTNKIAELQVNYDSQVATIEKPVDILKRIGLDTLLEKERKLNESLEI
jgi:hypothetical protein